MSSHRTLQILLSLSKSISPGPAPVFTMVHVCRAIMTIGDEGPIGRIELSRKLGLGEGVVRTIIRHLTSRNVVDAAKEGCALTQRGEVLYKSLRAKLSEVHTVNARQLALDKASAGVMIKNSASLVRRGVEQRDAAIRAGATGACTLVYRNSKLAMPMVDQEDWTLGPKDALFEDLVKSFSLMDQDVITIASAPKPALAEHCALAAALTLLR